MKTITEYFNYLYSLERTGMKYDLHNIKKILKELGNPEKNLKCIHIAGTNGKGATASFAASTLQESGLRTGLFTSPHILRFNERVRINSKMIPDGYVIDFLHQNRKLIKNVRPSFFEVNTALALKYFSDNNVDAAVIEAGLGGRLDSTNILMPKVSVITQIGMDHMQYLGRTLRKIALEKLGIVKPGVDTIISDNNAKLEKLFRDRIYEKYLFMVDDHCRIRNLSQTHAGTSFDLSIDRSKPLTLFTPLSGVFQARNAASAALAVKRFTDNTIDDFSIINGLKNVQSNTGYFGRLQSIKKDDLNYIFDISHNPAGIEASINNLERSKVDTVIFAMMADKDYRHSLFKIMNKFNNIIFTKPSYKRALEPEAFVNYTNHITKSLTVNLYISKDVRAALKIAHETTKKNGTVLIIGSFFLVSDAVKVLKLEKYFS